MFDKNFSNVKHEEKVLNKFIPHNNLKDDKSDYNLKDDMVDFLSNGQNKANNQFNRNKQENDYSEHNPEFSKDDIKSYVD